eukprot:4772898-Lingulodinium_polyedra.AAC.1
MGATGVAWQGGSGRWRGQLALHHGGVEGASAIQRLVAAVRGEVCCSGLGRAAASEGLEGAPGQAVPRSGAARWSVGLHAAAGASGALHACTFQQSLM